MEKNYLEEIKELFAKAEKHPSKANFYIKEARRLAMKYRIRLPSNLKKLFCKHCYTYLMPGVNSRVRTQNGKLVITCLECKKFTRFPLQSLS